jgi:hypothetical protein
MRKPIDDAIAAMKRAHQPILLADSDETRKTLRWELIRPRGFEPTIDTTANQKAYAAWIRYDLLCLQDGITRLQDNVREALGHPPRVRSEAALAFVAQSIADAKVKAEAVDADINAQFEKFMHEHQARSGANAAASRPPKGAWASAEAATPSGDDVRNRVWNVLHVEIFEFDEEDTLTDRRGSITLTFLREIWRDVLARPLDEVPDNFVVAWKAFRYLFMTCPEPTFYAIVQHAGGADDIREKLDEALERSGARYRFIGDKVLPTATDHAVT